RTGKTMARSAHLSSGKIGKIGNNARAVTAGRLRASANRAWRRFLFDAGTHYRVFEPHGAWACWAVVSHREATSLSPQPLWHPAASAACATAPRFASVIRGPRL